MRINKYLYLYVVQGDYGYGHGWEDLTSSESYRTALADYRAYCINDKYAVRHRIIKRREPNPEYKGDI